jgi:hypothetical protein
LRLAPLPRSPYAPAPAGADWLASGGVLHPHRCNMPELPHAQLSSPPQDRNALQKDAGSDREPRSPKRMDQFGSARAAVSRSTEPGWQVQQELEIGLQLH